MKEKKSNKAICNFAQKQRVSHYTPSSDSQEAPLQALGPQAPPSITSYYARALFSHPFFVQKIGKNPPPENLIPLLIALAVGEKIWTLFFKRTHC
jgi:hypothetical protein